MKILRYFASFGSKRPASAAKENAAAAGTPRFDARDGRPTEPKGPRVVSSATAKAGPPAAKRVRSLPTEERPRGAVRSVPLSELGGGTRPAVPPVGARGETDLAPSRATTENFTYPSVGGSADDVDLAAIRELFSDIASGQAAPVKSFIRDLRAKTATREWLEICRPVMAVLFESATSLGLGDAARPMSELISALELASENQEGKDGPIDDAARDVILEAYESLANAFPDAFALGTAENPRETMLLHALLKQVPGVGIVTLDALYGAGLTSLGALSQASPSDLSATTGISVTLCAAICCGLREHQLEMESTSQLPEEQRYGKRLKELLRALAGEHDTFCRLSEEAGFDGARVERKRASRRKRNLCALKIEATLIEMSQLDLADKLRVLAFDRRIDCLEEFLGVRVVKRAAEQR